MTLTELDQQRLLAIESQLQEHSFPPQVVVENTSCCTMRCSHCAHKELLRAKNHMKRDLWNRIVEEIGRESPETELWPTFYGEALILGDELWDRLAYAANAGCRNIVLNSNGMLLSRRNGYERILASPLRRFILSLDGFTKETFERIRVGGDRDSIYEQVETLLRLKVERQQAYPVIICQYSLMAENAGEAGAFRDYWIARGAEVKFRSMLEWTATGSIRAGNIDHETTFRVACPWGNNTMAIHQNGDAVACAVDYEGHFQVGNAREMSLRDLWAELGRRLRQVHRQHRWQDLPEICQGCRDWQVAGATYQEEQVAGTRPFWFYNGGTTNSCQTPPPP